MKLCFYDALNLFWKYIVSCNKTIVPQVTRVFFIRKWFIRKYYSAAQNDKKVQDWIFET